MCTTTKTNAYPVCQNGQCSFECNSGYFNCGGNCIPICTGGQTCINGSCQCPPGSPNFCNNQCVNYKTDNNSCGSCGKVCVGGQTCVNGVCTCPGDAPKFCGNSCVNPTNDNNDCGGCGNVCTGGRQCINSSCQCTGGTTWCNGSCRNLKTDPNNCGSCNNSCTSGVCQNGTCKSIQPARCPSGQQLFTFEIGGVVRSICCNSELNIFVPEVGPPVCCPNGICTNDTFTYCADSNGNC